MNGYDRNRESYTPSKAIGTEASQVSEQNPSGSTLISLEDITFISNSSPGYSLSADNNTKTKCPLHCRAPHGFSSLRGTLSY